MRYSFYREKKIKKIICGYLDLNIKRFYMNLYALTCPLHSGSNSCRAQLCGRDCSQAAQEGTHRGTCCTGNHHVLHNQRVQDIMCNIDVI